MSAYEGQRIALLTQHGKEQVIGPMLEPVLGCTIELVRGFDTDQLGTFTRETPRPGSQLNAACKKARIGMELSGLSLGLASEGSFGPDPLTGMFQWNTELLVLIDDQRNLEIAGIAQGVGRCGHMQTAEWSAIEAFAMREGFPEHHLVMRPRDQDDPRIQKGIADWGRLEESFRICSAIAQNGEVFVETDLRAFCNPTRMRQIANAAKDLAKRILSCCPTCDAPGYWITERKPGLPCIACGSPTLEHSHEVWKCIKCPESAIHPRAEITHVDPQHCDWCNP
jgi:hypothetical protein